MTDASPIRVYNLFPEELHCHYHCLINFGCNYYEWFDTGTYDAAVGGRAAKCNIYVRLIRV